MQSVIRRTIQWTPACFLGIGCLLVSGVREQKRMPFRRTVESIVVQAPGFVAEEQPIGAEERRIAGMDSYMRRGYAKADGTDAFSVYVGYYTYQVQGKTIHSPRNCLPGAGWEQMSHDRLLVGDVGGRSHHVNRYLMGKQGSQALVYYWYQGRGHVELSEYRVKWKLLQDAALYGRTEEALVRIVVGLDARQPATLPQQYRSADSLARAVSQQLIPQVDALMPVPPGSRLSVGRST